VEPLFPEPTVVGCDVSRITVADQGALEALARLQLAARRLGATIHLRNASPAFADLIELAGLADVLIVDPTDPTDPAGQDRDCSFDLVSGVEVDRQVEEGEEIRVDEEVHRGDDPV
jgi:hypothetical protein